MSEIKITIEGLEPDLRLCLYSFVGTSKEVRWLNEVFEKAGGWTVWAKDNISMEKISPPTTGSEAIDYLGGVVEGALAGHWIKEYKARRRALKTFYIGSAHQ